MKALRAVLRQTTEEQSLTKEDLMSKLLQRADFVGQREELDEIYENHTKSGRKDFMLYFSLQDKYDPEIAYLYDEMKDRDFYTQMLGKFKRMSLVNELVSESSSDFDCYLSSESCQHKKANKWMVVGAPVVPTGDGISHEWILKKIVVVYYPPGKTGAPTIIQTSILSTKSPKTPQSPTSNPKSSNSLKP
jgi:hypothetical protein